MNKKIITTKIKDLLNQLRELQLVKLIKSKLKLSALVLLFVSLPLTTYSALNQLGYSADAFLPATSPVTPPASPTPTPTLPATPPITPPNPTVTPTPTIAPTPTLTPIPTPTPNPNGLCQCDLWAVVEDNCNSSCTATCTGKFTCECITSTPNHSPVISTNYLPEGKIFRPYQTTIDGFDPDTNDSLSMTISGLPSGLRQRECVNNGNQISCQISGRAYRSGKYQIEIVLTDNQGVSVEKILLLKIKGWTWFWF